MPQYAVQWTLFPTSNLAADASTNNWSIEATGIAGLTNAITALRAFYAAVAPIYPDTVRQNNHTIKAYDRADPEPRAPVLSQIFNFLTPPSGATMPPENAIVLSFQAPPLSGTNQARRRGRVFLGPIDTTQLNTLGRPASATVTTVRNAANDLRIASVGAADWAWVVWSTVNLNAPEISNGWVDDEFDTQRRRGRLPTVRTAFP